MCIDDITLKKIKDISIYYGLDFYETKAGLLVSNGAREYFLLKFKNGSVRKLLHQNHARNGKVVSLPCKIIDIDNDVIRTHFHTQPWASDDVKKTLVYIYNHGRVRESIDARRRAIIDKMLVGN